MLAVCRSLNGFPKERAVVRREMARGHGSYGIGAYFFSKLLVETPVDTVFPVVFGLVLSKMSGLNKKGLGPLLKTLALQTCAASTLGVRVAFPKSRHTVHCSARIRPTVCSYKLRTLPERLTLFFYNRSCPSARFRRQARWRSP